MIKIYAFVFSLFIASNSLGAFVQNDEAAPDFKLLNSFGEEVSLQNYKGKKVVQLSFLYSSASLLLLQSYLAI